MQKQLSSLSRILIVAGLTIAVGAVFYMKQLSLSEQPSEPATVQTSVETPARTPDSLPRLVDLGSDKCQSCLAMVPVLEALTNDYEGHLEVVFIDVWKNPKEAGRFDIKLIPTQIFFDSGGNELFRHEGFFSKKDILAKWNDLGVKFDG